MGTQRKYISSTHKHAPMHTNASNYTHTISRSPPTVTRYTQHTSTATFTSDVHTQCKLHAHHNKLMLPVFPLSLTKTNGWKYAHTISPSPPAISHHTPVHTPHTAHEHSHTWLIAEKKLHSTSVSELWTAIVARTLAEEHWGGRQCRDTVQCIENITIPKNHYGYCRLRLSSGELWNDNH